MGNTSPSAPKLGIQLYTVRDLMDDAHFVDTMRRVAEFGFEGVEFAWKYGGMKPKELAAFLADLGLACCGVYVKLEELLDPNHEVYDYALAAGSPYVTTGLAGQLDQWDALIPQVEQAGRVAKDKGLVFTYHNHHQEFDRGMEGKYALDVLWERTDPDLVRVQLDLGWAHKAGAPALDYWRQYGERTPTIHLRDYNAETGRICDIGDGFIDPAAIVAQARELGTDWMIYEQDDYPVSAFDSCQKCMERMRPVLAE